MADPSKSLPLLFPWVPPDRETNLTKYPFIDDGEKKSIRIKRLMTSDIADVVPHVVEFVEKMNTSEIVDDEQFFVVFPRTLSSVLQTAWRSIYKDIEDGTKLSEDTCSISLKD